MQNFREWLSDNLRYFMLGGVIIVVGVGGFFGGMLYERNVGSTKSETVAVVDKTQSVGQSDKPEDSQIVAGDATNETQTDKNTDEEATKGQEEKDKKAAEEAAAKEKAEADKKAAEEAAAKEKEEAEKKAAEEAAEEAAAKEKAAAEKKAAEEAAAKEKEEADKKAAEEAAAKENEVVDYTKLPVIELKSGANLRSAGSMDSKVLGEYQKGQLFHLVEEGKGWHKVEINGVIGYIAAKFFD